MLAVASRPRQESAALPQAIGRVVTPPNQLAIEQRVAESDGSAAIARLLHRPPCWPITEPSCRGPPAAIGRRNRSPSARALPPPPRLSRRSIEPPSVSASDAARQLAAGGEGLPTEIRIDLSAPPELGHTNPRSGWCTEGRSRRRRRYVTYGAAYAIASALRTYVRRRRHRRRSADRTSPKYRSAASGFALMLTLQRHASPSTTSRRRSREIRPLMPRHEQRHAQSTAKTRSSWRRSAEGPMGRATAVAHATAASLRRRAAAEHAEPSHVHPHTQRTPIRATIGQPKRSASPELSALLAS